jgi:hypothetical protein
VVRVDHPGSKLSTVAPPLILNPSIRHRLCRFLASTPGLDIVHSTTPSLASLPFAVAFIRASPFLLTAILPIAPAILAPIHPPGLGDGERAVS